MELLADSYIGLGGDIWPLDLYEDQQSVQLQNAVENNSDYIKTSDGDEVYVCINKSIADDYFQYAKTKGMNVILLEINNYEYSLADHYDGIDYGDPTGGYSLIESELLMKENKQLVHDFLNDDGLFKDTKKINNFIKSFVEDKSDMDFYLPYLIKKLNI